MEIQLFKTLVTKKPIASWNPKQNWANLCSDIYMYTLIIHVASTDINNAVEKYILGRHFWGYEGGQTHR